MQLGTKKQMLLDQVKRNPGINLQQLVQLTQQYEDLQPGDFEGVVAPEIMEQLKEAGRDPNEVQLWNDIQNAPRQTPEQVQQAQRLVAEYLQRYAAAPKQAEALQLQQSLQQQMQQAMIEQQRQQEELRRQQEEQRRIQAEQAEWEAVDKCNYSALRNYKMKHPQTPFTDNIDDYMWNNTKAVVTMANLQRYLADWPAGRHAAEAQKAINSFGQWEEVKRSKDLFLVDDYKDNNPDSPFINEANALYYELRDEELKKMKENPSEYTRDDVERFINAGIFTQYELEDEGLVTQESWEKLQLDRELFPNIQDYQVENPNIQAPADCTDIYLFGTPGTGKTCLLMGLTAANGQGYSLNMRVEGGRYAAALQEYVNAGITPGRTFGKFVTVINGTINEQKKRDIVSHRINLVEMSGEEFALRISDNAEVSLANMGTGATNLLKNNNRKVFFIIVDSTKDRIKVEYIEPVKDAQGNIVDERIRKRYISQLDILNKFVGLFELPENAEIMKRVDAIHFIVTKADMLGPINERGEKARDLLLNKYPGPVSQIRDYCRRTKRVNYSTEYRPRVFTFSLGKFYLGDVFTFSSQETLDIIDTIRTVTCGQKEGGWWSSLLDKLG